MSLFRRKKAAPLSAPVEMDPFGGDPDARRIHGLVLARDWPGVEATLAAARDHDELDFLVSVAADVKGAEAWLADVAAANLDSPIAQLLYGSRTINWAWEARSRKYAQHVSTDQFELFFQRLRLAEDCLQGVVRRDPANATAWAQLVVCARGLQLGPAEARLRFDRATAAVPYHQSAHRQYQQNICRKWGGSHEQMHAFARESMLQAPAGNALAELVAIGHIEQWAGMDGNTAYITSRAVRESLREAVARSVGHPAYQRTRHWASIHNTFAAALSLAGEHQLAAQQFRVIGDIRTERPWSHFAKPGLFFALCRQQAFSKTPE